MEPHVAHKVLGADVHDVRVGDGAVTRVDVAWIAGDVLIEILHN